MNPKKICFIVCVNDKAAYQECLLYMQHLEVPKGMSVEYRPVWGVESMAAGYNQAMKSSEAKYKIYLHQDVFLIKKNLLVELINFFRQHSDIGIAGLAGCEILPASCIWWQAEVKYGRMVQMSQPEKIKEIEYGQMDKSYAIAAALDGVFLATQYDVPWREDIFKGWHFYDISQAYEFQLYGYKAAVLRQKENWCIHATGKKRLNQEYVYWQKVFGEKYM